MIEVDKFNMDYKLILKLEKRVKLIGLDTFCFYIQYQQKHV